MTDTNFSTEIHIAAACDDAYAMPLAVMLRSLGDTLAPESRIFAHVITQRLSKHNRDNIQASVDINRVCINWLDANDCIERIHVKIRTFDHVTLATYFRLMLPDLLPDELERILYLDSDMVVKADITPLWLHPLEDNHIAAVAEDSNDTRFVSSPEGVRLWRELGLPEHLEQFNAGVMLISLAKWRSDCLSERMLLYLERATEWVRWQDQDALNAMIAGNWLALDPEWNTMSRSVKSMRTSAVAPSIVHYNAAHKPWHYDYSCALREPFYRTLDNTAWKGWRPTQPRLPMARRLLHTVSKAMQKRVHAVRLEFQLRKQSYKGNRLLSRRPVPVFNAEPDQQNGGEIRVFLILNTSTPFPRDLLMYYLQSGASRVIVGLLNTSRPDATLLIGYPQGRLHLVAYPGMNSDAALRALLHRFGQGHWCLLAQANCVFRFPGDDEHSLEDLVAELQNENATALQSTIVHFEVPFAGEESIESVVAALQPIDCLSQRIPIVQRDPVRNRVFLSRGLYASQSTGVSRQLVVISAVSLLKYDDAVMLGPAAAEAGCVSMSTRKGLLLSKTSDHSESDVKMLCRINWQQLRAR